jgi:hypothetical protein
MRWWPMPPGGPPSEEQAGRIDDAVRDTISRCEEAGSPVIIQKPLDVPKYRESLRAVLGVIPRRPLTISLTLW